MEEIIPRIKKEKKVAPEHEKESLLQRKYTRKSAVKAAKDPGTVEDIVDISQATGNTEVRLGTDALQHKTKLNNNKRKYPSISESTNPRVPNRLQ